jgi:hypothetical protein
VSKGVNISPRGQTSPLGGKLYPWGPSSPLGGKLHPWGLLKTVLWPFTLAWSEEIEMRAVGAKFDLLWRSPLDHSHEEFFSDRPPPVLPNSRALHLGDWPKYQHKFMRRKSLPRIQRKRSSGNVFPSEAMFLCRSFLEFRQTWSWFYENVSAEIYRYNLFWSSSNF